MTTACLLASRRVDHATIQQQLRSSSRGHNTPGPPDLHPLGQIFHVTGNDVLSGYFLHELALSGEQQRRRGEREQRPKQYVSLSSILFAQWAGTWLLAFVADRLAPSLGGPSFGAAVCQQYFGDRPSDSW